jgi:hypothetical protein
MDALEQHGLNSLRWFLADLDVDLPNELRAALGAEEYNAPRIPELLTRCESLTAEQVEQLCVIIKQSPRTFFGVLNPAELVAFVRMTTASRPCMGVSIGEGAQARIGLIAGANQNQEA